MGALRQPLSNENLPPKKPVKQALNRYGRDPNSPSEKLRVSDYDLDKGYAPLFHSFLADWPRISRGHVSDLLMMAVLAKSLGRGGKKGEGRQQSTTPTPIEEFAQVCRCDVRSIQRELAYFESSGIASVENPTKGKVVVTLLYRKWEALPDHAPKVVDISTGQEPEELTEEEQAAKEASTTKITRKPVKLAAGQSSKAIPVNCGVKSFRYQITGPVDVEFEAVVQAGELLVVSRVSDEWLKKIKIANTQSSGVNNLASPPRHGCRDNVSGDRRIQSEHPRAAELIDLFDPLLKRWQSRLLSADDVALQAACEAIGQTDHNFLIHFLQFGKNPRAGRNISGPRAVVAICTEARKNWETHPNVAEPAETAEAAGLRRFRERQANGGRRV